MYARVTTFPGLAPERIKATLAEFTEHLLPRLEQEPGYQGVWAGVDFAGGRAIAVTVLGVARGAAWQRSGCP